MHGTKNIKFANKIVTRSSVWGLGAPLLIITRGPDYQDAGHYQPFYQCHCTVFFMALRPNAGHGLLIF